MRACVLVALTSLTLAHASLGANCEWKYLASLTTLPNAQGWTFDGGSVLANATASSGVLTYGPTTTSGTTFWVSTVPSAAMDFTKFSWSISAEVKLTGATYGNVSGFQRGGFVIGLSDKNGRYVVADIGSSALGIRNDNNGTSDPNMLFDLASGFHTVTLEAGPSGGRLLIDGVQKLTLALGTGGGSGTAYFGEASILASAVKTEIRRIDLVPSKEPCPGDVNCDTFVNDLDFETFVYGYNLLDCADPTMTPNCPADLNHDGFVDDADFTIFVGMYNQLECFPA